ncbi:MAG: acetyltransferase [Proteobacteria bacterium]|nr:acetyltransferase [Pseudomonadota bacterium]
MTTHTKRPLVIAGDSSFAEVAAELFDAEGRYEVVAFAVHEAFRKKETLLGRPVHALEHLDRHCPPGTHDAFVALTYRELNRARARICKEMKQRGYHLASYISAHAYVWPKAPIGENCFIFENNVIQPFCSIGDNVILWSGNHIGHHSTIEDNVFVASHVVVSGHCRIGRNTFIGVNATIADQVSVAADNWIGPATLITKDTEADAMYRAESTPKGGVGAKRFFRVKSDA